MSKVCSCPEKLFHLQGLEEQGQHGFVSRKTCWEWSTDLLNATIGNRLGWIMGKSKRLIKAWTNMLTLRTIQVLVSSFELRSLWIPKPDSHSRNTTMAQWGRPTSSNKFQLIPAIPTELFAKTVLIASCELRRVTRGEASLPPDRLLTSAEERNVLLSLYTASKLGYMISWLKCLLDKMRRHSNPMLGALIKI